MSHACFNQDNDSEQEQQQTEQKTQLTLCLQKTFDLFSEEKLDKETIDSKVKILNRYLNRMKVKDEQMKAKPSYWINHTLAIEFTSMTGRSLNNINSPAV